MKYKALIMDVDGTLVVNSKEALPTKRVSDAIEKASKQVFVGIATSRCLQAAHKVLDHLKLSGPSILNGGGQIIEFPSEKTLSDQPLNKEDAKQIYDSLQKHQLRFFICDGKTPDALFNGIFPEKEFMIYTQGHDSKFAQELVTKLSHIPTVSIFTTHSWTAGKTDVLFTHVQATKQHGILEVAKILNIDTKEIIGVGDGYNDFPLLMACGLKVAMGNAVDDLKAIADYVAPPVDEDGVAHVIEKFVLQQQ